MLGKLFQCDPDLRLVGTDVYLDPSENRRTGIISHGHADHIGRHDSFLATPPTAAFLRLRVGSERHGIELPFGMTHCIGPYEVDFLPAGHVLGSGMIRVRSEEGTLLYTGDFRLRPARTAEPARVEACDWLVMESTYGSPFWRFPDRDGVERQLLELLNDLLGGEYTPVILAYSLGKAQEAMALLGEADLPCVVHPAVAASARIYERFGVSLGRWEMWATQGSLFDRSTRELRGKVLILPPQLRSLVRKVARAKTLALTGWALDPRRTRWADYAFPFSDHADFDELIEMVERSSPSIVYTTHGASAFARELRARGIQAEFLRRKPQMRLF